MEDSYVKLGRGEIVIFPSFILHRVTPVTKGKRRVIVGWALGPNFV
jgi:PKHD-type hydroxylase